MRTTGEIMALVDERKATRGPLIEMMRDVRDAYNADIALPTPGLHPNERAAVANLLQQGLDGTSQRISSTMPDVRWPALRPNIKTSQDLARLRRQVDFGWWEMNRMALILGRRARHFTGYACAPVMIRPDTERGIPQWVVRDPLGTYPAAPTVADDMLPADAAFCYWQTVAWVKARYPGSTTFLAQTRGGMPRTSDQRRDDDKVEMIEYVDADEIVLLATGRREGTPGNIDADWGDRTVINLEGGGGYFKWGVELARYANRAERCTVVVPGRLTLDRLQSQFEGMIGKFLTQAKLAALELIAIEEGIWPKEWVVSSDPNIAPEVIQQADGRRGIVGEIKGGTMHVTQANPGYKTDSAIDRLERAQRLEGGVPAEMGGESSSSTVKTGRRGDHILAAAIDFNIAEAQRILEFSLADENRVAVAVQKGWFGSRPVSFYVDWKGARGHVDIKAGGFGDVFETDRNVVKYSLAGSDLNQQMIRQSNQLGVGLISKQTAREVNPEIEDPELEEGRVLAEALRDSVLDEIRQPGSMTVVDKARVAQLVEEKKQNLFEAVLTAQREAQERQATSGPPGTPAGAVAPGSPEAQPGLAPPGLGAEAGVTIAPPEASLANLTQRLNQMRTSVGAENTLSRA